MKVLIVTEDLPAPNLGGAGKHAVLLGNALRRAGHEVELLGRRADGAFDDPGFDGVLHRAIDLSGTGWQEFRFGAFLPGRREHAARRVWAAIGAVGAGRFDVIHYHGHLYALGRVVPADLPFVQTVHDQGADCMTHSRFRANLPCAEQRPEACAACATPAPNALQRTLSAAAVRRHRRVSGEAFARHPVIFVSDFLRQRFEAHVQPRVPPKAHVVHNFTDAARLSRLAPTRGASGRPTALMVGRIDATKGFGALLDLLPDAVLAHWRLRVIGDGPMRAELQARHGPRGVEFAGLLPQAATYAETAAADLCIVPSIWEEPCGTTLLEALALGKPVLALARGGTPELSRYERFAGQLRLFPDLQGVAACLAEARQAPAVPAALGPDDLADVQRRLPEIVAVYEAARRHPPSANG